MTVAKILVVDDEPDMLKLIERILVGKGGYSVITCSDPFSAIDILHNEKFHLIVVDLKMPGMDGISFIQEARTIQPDVEALVITAYGTIETAVEAVKKGAFDYITKPFKKERLLLAVSKALEWRRIIVENRALREIITEHDERLGIIGDSDAISGVYRLITQVAPTHATVLITGASGTGKELVARAIHRLSPRKEGKFITLNCAAIPETIMESELFGYTKGAFTGAWRDRKGLIEEAKGGTLFLDEIGDMPGSVQAKLLRILEYGEYRSLGSNELKKADVRIVAATNKNLEKAVVEKTFREDLYFRLKVFHIHIPTLDERKEDIPVLAQFFLRKYSHLHGKSVKSISQEALKRLISRQWPGNVRELANTIERAVIMAQGETLDVGDFFIPKIMEEGSESASINNDLITSSSSFTDDDISLILKLPFKDAKANIIRWFHRVYVTSLLRRCGGNVSQAAELAGIQRQYLHQIMKEESIDASTFRSQLPSNNGVE